MNATEPTTTTPKTNYWIPADRALLRRVLLQKPNDPPLTQDELADIQRRLQQLDPAFLKEELHEIARLENTTAQKILASLPVGQAFQPAGSTDFPVRSSNPSLPNTPLTPGHQADTSRTNAGQEADPTRTPRDHNPANTRPAGGENPAAPLDQLSYTEREILAHLRPKSPLDELPPARLKELAELLDDYSEIPVLKVITLPEPHGWGLTTSRASLIRFRERHQKIRQLQKQKEIQAAMADPVAFARLLENLLNQRLYDKLIDPKSKTNEVRDLYQSHLRKTLANQAAQRYALKSTPPHPCEPTSK